MDDPGVLRRRAELALRITDPALERLGVDPAGKRVLEIGCGMGRLFPGLAERFDDVWGIDISSTMIARGRKHCPVQATWLIGDGRSLPGVKDDVDRSRAVVRGVPAHS